MGVRDVSSAPRVAVPGRATRRDLLRLLAEDPAARGLEDAPALAWDGGSWTFGELSARGAAAAAWLSGEGVRRGDLLLLALPDSAEWIAVFLGASRIGAQVALASPGVPGPRLEEAAGRLAPRAILSELAWPRVRGRRLDPEAARAAVATPAAGPAPAPLRADDPAYLLLTSGSTGPPKWAVHRAGDIPACVATYGRRVLRLRPGDRTWSVAALPTSYGLGNSCYFPLAAGACAVLAGADRSPAACAAACAEHRVTALFGVPTSWARLARHAAEGRVRADDLSTVRLAVSAGEALPATVWRAVEDALGLRLVNGLGSSEASNLYLSDRPGAPRPGTVGWRVAGYDVRIRDEAGRDADEGELWVRGPTVMAGYRGDGAATARALTPDGWLRTGDRVRREADGSHAYLGRLGDRFKAGGLWVDAARVREALEAHPLVSAAVVLPVRDPEGLVRVGAAVATGRAGDDPALRRALRDHAAVRLARHEVPRALALMPALPVTASGKADRAEVARLLAAVADPSLGREPAA